MRPGRIHIAKLLEWSETSAVSNAVKAVDDAFNRPGEKGFWDYEFANRTTAGRAAEGLRTAMEECKAFLINHSRYTHDDIEQGFPEWFPDRGAYLAKVRKGNQRRY